jgi:hypothetical protein
LLNPVAGNEPDPELPVAATTWELIERRSAGDPRETQGGLAIF